MHDPAPYDAPSPLVPTPRAPALVLAGLVMLALPFVAANPSFGLDERAWPWSPEARSTLHGDVLALLWGATALWCVLLGMTRHVRLRAVGAAALAAMLLVEVTRGIGPLAVTRFDLAALLPWIVLGGGLRVLAEPSGRRLGGAWAALGALWALWALAATFPGGGIEAHGVGLYRDALAFLDDGARDWSGRAAFWQTLLPAALGVAAALLGLLAAALGGRRLAHVAFTLLLLGVALPGLGDLIENLAVEITLARVLDSLRALLIDDGLLAWWLGVFVVGDLGRARMRAGDGGTAEDEGGGRLRLAVHLLALLGVAGLALCLFNPDWGALASAWPHDVLATGAWTPAAARAAAVLLLTALLVFGLVWKPSRARGWFLLLAVGAVLLAFAPTRAPVDEALRIPLAVAIVAAALLLPGPRAVARGGRVVGLALLAVLLFMPWDVVRIQATTPGERGYRCTALTQVDAVVDGAEQAWVATPTPRPPGGAKDAAIEGRTGVILWALPTAAGLLLLALGLLARVVPPRVGRALALLGLLLAVVGPGLALALYTADPWRAQGIPAWAEGLQTWARFAAGTGGVWALALAVALMDRRRAAL